MADVDRAVPRSQVRMTELSTPHPGAVGSFRPHLVSRSSSAASVGDERHLRTEWEEGGSAAGEAQQQHHHQYQQQPRKGQTQGLLLEGRKGFATKHAVFDEKAHSFVHGSRSPWPPVTLLIASVLLIAFEVYFRTAVPSQNIASPQGSPSGLPEANSILDPSKHLSAGLVATEHDEWGSRDKSLAETVAALAQRASSLQAASARLEQALAEMRRGRRQRATEEVQFLVHFEHHISAVQQEAMKQSHTSLSVNSSGLHLPGMLEQLQSYVHSHLTQWQQAALQAEDEEKDGMRNEEEEEEERGGGQVGLGTGFGTSSSQTSNQGAPLLQPEQESKGSDAATATGRSTATDTGNGMGNGGGWRTWARSSTGPKEQLLASWDTWLSKETKALEDRDAFKYSSGEGDFSWNSGEAKHSGPGSWGVPSLSPVPLHPPHLQDCVATAKMVRLWDARKEDGSMPYWSPLGARTELATRQALLRAAEALAAKAEAKKKRKGTLWRSVQEALDLLADTEAQWQALENQAEMAHQRALIRGRVHRRQMVELQPGMTHGTQGSRREEAQWQALESWREGSPQESPPESGEGPGRAQGAVGGWHAEVQRQAHDSWQKSRGDDSAEGVQQQAEAQVQEGMGLPRRLEGARAGAVFPPWVRGADEDLLVLTRAVQHDLWQLQHPRDCTLPSTNFLVVNASQLYSQYMGVGAQVAWLTGALAEAVNEGRVMVISFYERADHDGCKGDQRARWECYFAPETTEQCRTEALRLAQDPAAVRSRRVTFSSNRTPRPTRFFFYRVPRLWGQPWKLLHRTVEVGGVLTGRTHTDSRRWWFAQATRYLMRYSSPRLCSLLNGARHHAFGDQVADLVLAHGPTGDQEAAWGSREEPSAETEQGMPVKGIPLQLRPGVGLAGVWAATRQAYVPHGLISVHVRQGDKDREMRLYGFGAYMSLASRIRAQFPHASSVWLSTEMASVVREAETNYPQWTFHYTDFPRQTEKNVSMSAYERQLGMKRTSDNAFVNLLMASEAEFFVGALGSTWSLLIDNLRVTSGKGPSGFVSVNGDRYWYAKRTAGDDGHLDRGSAGDETVVHRQS